MLTKIKLGFISGPFLLLVCAVGMAWASNDDLYSFIRLFDRVALVVADKYIDQLDNEKLIHAGIEGMMEKLDPYSRYLTYNDYYYLMQETQGEYAGIGINIDKTNDSLWVNEVIKNSPAARSNIKIGDRLLLIDTISTFGRSATDCRKLLRGDKGTSVVLTVWRPLLNRQFNITLIREEIYIEPVPSWFVDRYNNGYIKISRFSDGCIYEVKSAISILKTKNINGLILDLRDNPGGLLYESVEVAALFLDEGDNIVETRSRGGVSISSYKAREDGIYNQGPLTVLVNQQTASAAEIVAGAIQDNDRGLIIGSTSYGKGLVQQIMQFSDNSGLKLTTAKYYTPSARCIQKDKQVSELVQSVAANDKMLFYTQSGRPVFGGGGIIPDIYIEPFNYPPLLDEIITLGYVDEFVKEKSAKVKVDENFVLDEDVIDDFLEFLHDKGYMYHNPAFIKFQQFRERLNDLDYISGVTKPADDIERALKQTSEIELTASRPQLRELLYDYFISLNLGEKMVYRLARQYTDPEIIKAGEVLSNKENYGEMLVGN